MTKNISKEFINKAINICEDKIRMKGDGVGISFYVFFQNKNDNPELLFAVAKL
jgi:hypothetical protein